MYLNDDDFSDFNELLNPIKKHKLVQSMKDFTQHGGTSTYEHCKNISKVCFHINRKFNLKCKEEDLVIGAMLHDFYLYDWHIKQNPSVGLHGFVHPKISKNNADKYFNINNNTKHIIRSHMWPLTLLNIPMTREAWLVSCIDKYCSTQEVFTNFFMKK